MRLRRAHPGAAALGLLLVVAGAVPAVAVSAAAPAVPLELPGDTVSAVTADLDRDGTPELLRLVESARGMVALEAWSVGNRGWRMLDAVGLGPTLAAEDRQPALLSWHRDDLSAVALIEPRTVRASTAEPCCIALTEVRLEAGRLSTRVQPMPITSSIDRVQTVDLDADGTDELVLVEFVGTDRLLDPEQVVHVLRLVDGSWESAWRTGEAVTSLAIVAGDADGEPGEELYLGPDHAGRLLRVAASNGRLIEETTTVPLRSAPWAEVVGVLDEAILVRAPDDLVAHRWPRGAEGTVAARARPRGLGGVAVLGIGGEARVVTSRGYQTPSQGAITLFDGRLQAAGRFGESAAAGLIWDLVLAHAAPLFNLDRSIFPYIGPIPVGLDEPEGFLANGALARVGASGVEVAAASPLLGYAPVGLVGPGGTWMVLRDDPSPPDHGAVLTPARSDPTDRLVALPAADVLEAPQTELGPMLRFSAAVRQATHEARADVRAAAGGFDVDVAAPPGSLVAVVGQRFDSHVMDGDPWTLRVEPPARLTGAAGDPGQGDRPFRRWVLVVLPNGEAVAERWDGVFVEDPPLLEVRAAGPNGDGLAEITGRTQAGNRVRVAGAAVGVDASGEFATSAAIELLPRSLPVEVVDPFGSVTRSTLTVPGVIDPAGLPWIPLAVAATIVAAVVMFLRVPNARRASVTVEEGDGRLEEIDGD